tara:strand:- start:100 stop:459 length:360 start_codon:yes stop_codon:yes gene_type:complete
MRVQVTYTIPLEESLDKSEEFFNEAYEQISEVFTELSKIKSEGALQQSPVHTHQQLDSIRKSLFDLDSKFSNAMNLIAAYVSKLSQSDSSAQQPVDVEALQQQIGQLQQATNQHAQTSQ